MSCPRSTASTGSAALLARTKVPKYQGGIPFTYGPLAYFLKNRIYLGETHHGGKWFKGEHDAIVDRDTFDRVQQLLKGNASRRKSRRSESGAMLMGILYDDRGNLMSPTFSCKNGVRYRFYVSSALLRGRKTEAGSAARVSAIELENSVLAALQTHQRNEGSGGASFRIERVVVASDKLIITLAGAEGGNGVTREIRVGWTSRPRSAATVVECKRGPESSPNQSLIQSVVRAHAWTQRLHDGTFESIEALAVANRLHPKVVRIALRLAFLSPEVTSAILEGRQQTGLSPGKVPKLLPLAWTEHQSQA